MLFVTFFVCLNNLVFHVRVPVGVFYLNMSKRGKKQDVNDEYILTRSAVSDDDGRVF